MRYVSMILVLVAAVAVAGAGCENNNYQTSSPPVAASSSPTGKVLIFSVQAGKVAGPDNLQVKQGDTVTIQVTADTKDEVHLHGYDLKTDVAPGDTAKLTFTATKAGRFEVELENAKTTLGEIEVQPK